MFIESAKTLDFDSLRKMTSSKWQLLLHLEHVQFGFQEQLDEAQCRLHVVLTLAPKFLNRSWTYTWLYDVC